MTSDPRAPAATTPDLTAWVEKRIIELCQERAAAVERFKRTDDDRHLDQLIAKGGKIRAYGEVFDYIKSHAAPPPSPRPEADGDERIAWLIERPQAITKNGPLWWTGTPAAGNWTLDANDAVRFTRRQDAERVIHAVASLAVSGAIATEHVWLAPLRAPSAGAGEAERLREAIKAAQSESDRLCHGKPWRMSIPVRDDDSDIIFGDLIRAARALSALGSEGEPAPLPKYVPMVISESAIREIRGILDKAHRLYVGTEVRPVPVFDDGSEGGRGDG